MLKNIPYNTRYVQLITSVLNFLIDWNTEWPEKPYQAGVTDFWKCEATIPVFQSGGGKRSQKSPPTPRPRTVQLRYSKTVGAKYWANTCPKCKSIRGDWFLQGVDGPFGINYDPETILLSRAQEVGLLP